MLDGDALSAMFGWISFACWISVCSPQLYENYRLQSGEGLSVLFILMLTIGDLSNLIGAILGRLVPTIILVVVYYITMDITLLAQIYYYRWKRRRYARRIARAYGGSEEPLLGAQACARVATEPESLSKMIVMYTLSLLFISAVGVGAWWVGERKKGVASPEDNMAHLVILDLVSAPGGGSEIGSEEGDGPLRKWAVQVFGWTSAILCMGAKFPQIWKNFETRCKGLSPALFVFGVFGNLTYVASICAKSMEKDYLFTNISWIVSASCSATLRCIIIGQIIYYRFTKAGRAGAIAL